MSSGSSRKKFIASLVEEYIKDPSFKPALSPAAMQAFREELQKQRDRAQVHPMGSEEISNEGEVDSDAESVDAMATGDMPTLQEAAAADREERARKAMGSTKKIREPGRKRALVDEDPIVEADSEVEEQPSIEERKFAKAKVRPMSEATAVETPMQQAPMARAAAYAGMTPKEIQNLKDKARTDLAMSDWIRQQQGDFNTMMSKANQLDEYFAARGESHDGDTAEDVAEIVGQRLDNRHKPSEWKADTVDDPASWMEFYDNFQRHILHKGRSHPKAYIAPRLLRTLEHFMAQERNLDDWQKLSNSAWLEAINVLLSNKFGWSTVVEEVSLQTRDMIPLWEDFLESCRPMVHNRTLTEKEKKRKVVDAIQSGGYSYESLQLREFIEDDSIDFKSFLRPVTITLGQLATIAKRLLRKNAGAAQDAKRRRVEPTNVMAITGNVNTLRCSNCLKMGHTTRECRSLVVCHLCQQQGHFAKNCQQKAAPGRGHTDRRNTNRGGGGRRERQDYNRHRGSNFNTGGRGGGRGGGFGRSTSRPSRPPIVAFASDYNTNNNSGSSNSNSFVNSYSGFSNNMSNNNPINQGNSYSDNNYYNNSSRVSDNRFSSSNNNNSNSNTNGRSNSNNSGGFHFNSNNNSSY